MHRRAIARDDPTAAARATVGKGGRPVCCGRRGFWDGSRLRDGPVAAGPDGPLRRRHRPAVRHRGVVGTRTITSFSAACGWDTSA